MILLLSSNKPNGPIPPLHLLIFFLHFSSSFSFSSFTFSFSSFTLSPLHIISCHSMPVTPATALLFDQPFVMIQYPILAARLPPPALSTSKLCAANHGMTSYTSSSILSFAFNNLPFLIRPLSIFSFFSFFLYYLSLSNAYVSLSFVLLYILLHLHILAFLTYYLNSPHLYLLY